LAELDPHIIEGVAYSPLKVSFKLGDYDESLELRCDSCRWTTTVGDLPQETGYVCPDLCPDCAKQGDLGFVRCQSPADGSFPSGWTDSSEQRTDDSGGDNV